MIDCCDALVIGGGPGGSATALLLARAGWSVIVLERKAFPRGKVCGEYLSATSLPLLDELGVGTAYREVAGPEVRRVGLLAGAAALTAKLPAVPGRAGWGRALGRDRLDAMLLRAAAAAGADVWQPWSAASLEVDGAGYHCVATSHGREPREVGARIVVAAHGSWDIGLLPTQPRRRIPRPGDLLGFKAHFRGSTLPPDLMPLLAFPGGYGGMVTCDRERVSLSCCVRCDRLASIRRSGENAGDSVLKHIRASCRGVDDVLANAERDGPWLAAGPIRPGIRLRPQGGVFRVGNAAGEAHPVVAEGISMALQGAWLLAERLCAWRQRSRRWSLAAVGADYARAWRRTFGPRLVASSAIAHWAMQPTAVAGALPLIRRLPAILTWAARLSGKARQLV